MDWYVARHRKTALSRTFPEMERRSVVQPRQKVFNGSQTSTFNRAEDEERNDRVVQAAGRLGDAGQDGERVQQVTVGGEQLKHLLVNSSRAEL